VIGRDGDEAGIADHIDQNFHPRGHDAPFPANKLARAMLVPAQSDDQTRSIAWLAIACGPSAPQLKTPPTSEDVDGVFRAFTSRKVAALVRKRRGAGFVPAIPKNSLPNSPKNSLGATRHNALGRRPRSFWRVRFNARTRACRFRSVRWPASSRNTPRARV
jgi:hypothetical protein